MTYTFASLISGLLFLVLTPIALWWLRREYRQRGKLTWFGSLVHIAAYTFHGMFMGVLIWGPQGIASMKPLAWIGIPLMVIGVGITVYAMDLFRTFSRWVGNQTPGLRTGGLYRYSRNPQFVGYGLLILGCILAWWNTWAWLGMLAYCILVYFVARIEEEHLTGVYGEAYRGYCSRVPRFF
jgi:protein-S-isoprenylcysteine O-methyltransferase Ste14